MSVSSDNQRINFATVKNPLPYPDFLEVQLKSFKDFLQLDTPPEKRNNEGLFKVFAENFPYSRHPQQLRAGVPRLLHRPPRYTIDECLERGLTYSVPPG